MSRSMSIRNVPFSILALAAALACGDSSAAPDGGDDPLQNLVQLQSPDTARGGGGGGSPPAVQGDGFFRGVVKGYSEADFPDTLRSAKPLANATATAYPAELTDREPKLGPPASVVTTNASGGFTFPTLAGGLYVVTFVPPSGAGYESAWTLATAHSGSGDRPWTIMLRLKK